MISIIENEDNKINYECSCGIKGFCLFKPIENSGIILFDICCPGCRVIERIFILQYLDSEDKEELLKNIPNLECDWMISEIGGLYGAV